MKVPALFAALVLGVSAIPTYSEAAENQSAVEYRDLNLASSEGRAAFDRRLEKAVREVCRSGPTRSIRAASDARNCVLETKARLAPLREALFAQAIKSEIPDTLAARVEP